MFPAFGITEALWLVGGWMAKEQLGDLLDPKKRQQASAAPVPQLGPGQGPGQWVPAPQALPPPQAQPHVGGAYAPGMPVDAPVVARKPLGPVALDAHVEESTERDVWRCLTETDEKAARQFAVALAQGGLPVAASIVSYHAFQLGQLRQVQAAAAPPAPRPEAPVYAAPAAPEPPTKTKEREALPAANGFPVTPHEEVERAPFVPRSSAE